MKVLFQYHPKAEIIEYISSNVHPNAQLVFAQAGDKEALIKLAADADVMVGWQLPDALLDALSNLKLFINPAAGINRLVADLGDKRPSFPIVNSHDNTVLTAQHAVALLLSVSSQIVVHHNLMLEGKWRTRDPEGISTPLIGSDIGILGYGSVGKRIHHLLQPFGAKFHLLKTDWPASPESAKTYSPDQLDRFLDQIDQLIVTLPLTPQTRDLLGYEELCRLGTNGVLVNVGRGEVVNEEGLYRVLKEKKIKGAGIDVWYNYRPEPDENGKKWPYSFPFKDLDNVVLSPHRAGSPDYFLPRWDDVIYNINQMVSGEGKLINHVDLDRQY